MADSERGTPSVLPMTPDTPGGPLFSSVRIDSLDHDSFAMARCNVCMPKGVRIPSVTLTQKVGAEFVGTFILIYVATAGPIVNNKYEGIETLIGNAACAGLTVMAIILSIGHISGAHLNPSLTIAFAAFRHFPWAHVPAYIAAQVSASICACYALKVVYRPFLSGGVTLPTVTVGQAFATEFIITFILLFVATAVATDTRAVRSRTR
ncbi:probable aquaporin NIP5-1 [Lathyrus oleraceus]|uniref:probable aquaporin NIP5-1 n=1 Tax=Pisum sativum TaxID=3888 RepID=UPI0021CE781D|nr:probable aquaporin NIP5-1 [Pisum sativum]